MISLEEARPMILEAVQPGGAVCLPLDRAYGLHAARELPARVDLPPFDNSAMDGYAVRADELQGATVSAPRVLRCTGRVAAGGSSPGTVAAMVQVEQGCCARIFTGGLLPPGADAVVMQEEVRVEGEQVFFTEPVRPFENVRFRGEDVRSGTVILRPGDRLHAGRLALLSAGGQGEVWVHRAPVVTLLATGQELKEAGTKLLPGEIYESNRVMLSALLRDIGCAPRLEPPVTDTLEATMAALASGFAQSPVVIATGGVSVGELDYVKEAFARLGGAIELWKVAMRPGKPFVFGRWEGQCLFGLPGNPVSALVTFLMLVRPALLKMLGAANLELPTKVGLLAEPLLNRGDRRHFVRVIWEAGQVRAAGPQASHRLGDLGEANGLVDLPPETRLEAGREVSVLVWR